MAIRHRVPFAPEFNFVVKRPFTFNGREYQPGEEFDKANVNVRLLQKIYEQHKIDAVIPTFTIKKDVEEPEAETPPPVKKPAKAKPKAVEPAAPAKQYRLEGNFGTVKIMDGDTVVRECADLDEAKAAMAELSEG